VESLDFAQHWCFEDEQCLELCNHDENCEHQNVSTTWRTDGTAHWHVCQDCGLSIDKALHTEGTPVTLTSPDTDKHINGTARISCSVCNTQMSIISIPYVAVPTDGKPYILIQPTDYTGKTKSIDEEGPTARFIVKAGGENLSYQWYEKRQEENFEPINEAYGKKATLEVEVEEDYFDQDGYKQFYCVVSNANGSVRTNTVAIKAQHLFGMYYDEGDGTHGNYCWGDCGTKKYVEKHRFSEWTLVKAATSTTTGLREQKCLLCDATNTEVIPKVEPNHVHEYNIAKYNLTQHWFVCSCGIASSEPAVNHNFDQTEVITEPTEKRMGSNKITCSACGYSKTVRTDKLPHEHVWYSFSDTDMFIWGDDGRLVPDPEMGGRGLESHHVNCKGCDQRLTETHTWSMWECTRAATEEVNGKMRRQCEVCGYSQTKLFPYGSWPIMIVGGDAYIITMNESGSGFTADPVDYAVPGTEIFIRFNPKSAKLMSQLEKPVKFVKWFDGPHWIGETNIPWDGGKSDIDLPNLTFLKPQSINTTFDMPDGPATIFAGYEVCTHTGGTKQGDRVEASCSGHGHEPHTLCKDCDEVLEEGARIEALGHDLPDTPIEGTEEVEYCNEYYAQSGDNAYRANEATHGYAGDYLCNRCGKTVKGKGTPLKHGVYDRWGTRTKKDWKITQNYVPATCTINGYTGDDYCKYCGKLVQRGQTEKRLGHDWSDWETIREATTKVKGIEQRYCLYDDSHVETRITDYSGPDYTLKPDKTKLHFEWTYGDPIPSQTITFRSTGRNEILAITYAEEENQWTNLSHSGMMLTVTPILSNEVNSSSENIMALYLKVSTKEGGETSNITIPEISTSSNIKKTTEKYTLTVEDGLATTFTFSDGKTILDTNRSNELQVRGGEWIQLEPEDKWKKDFLRWEVADDASGMIQTKMADGWATEDNPRIQMSPNNVTVRAIYKKNTPTLAFSQTEVTVSQAETLVEPTLNAIPGSLPITYSSSDTRVATVNAKTGEITLRGAGTATITATSAETNHYSSATASYTLIVPQGLALIGDVNNDGSVTIADLPALIYIVLGKDTAGIYNHDAADVNGDGSISITDVTVLVNILLEK